MREQGIAELLLDMERRLGSRIEGIAVDLAVVKADVTSLREDVDALKSDVATLKSDVATLKIGMSNLQFDVAKLHSSDDKIIKMVSNLAVVVTRGSSVIPRRQVGARP